MNITLSLGDFLAIAAIVVIFARGWQVYFAAPTPEQLRMQRQLDAIMKNLGLVEPPASRPGALSSQVAALIAAGRKIEAIKLYRQETGEGLKQAKAAVEGANAATVAATGR
jgi:ribosomal protein L7/L12